MEIVPKTPVKPIKFYVRRKSIKHIDKPAQDIYGSVISPHDIDPHKEEFEQDNSQSSHQKEEKKNSDEERERKCHESDTFQGDPEHVSGKRKRNNSKVTQKKKRFHRPRIMEEGKKPRDPTTTLLRTISKKKTKKDNNSEEEAIPEPPTPAKKSSFSERRKTEKTKRNVARAVNFNLSCLELDRICGPTFPIGRKRKRMTQVRRSDFHCLISPFSFPMPAWKKQSKRSNRRKNVVRWFRIALSLELQEKNLPLGASHQNINNLLSQADVSLHSKDSPMRQVNRVVPKQSNKSTKNIAGNLIQQMSYQKDHGLSSLADVPLHIEDTLMRSSYVPVEQSKEKTKDIAKLIKEMRGLKINKKVTTLIKSGKKRVSGTVNLDPETIKEWELLMVNDLPSISHDDKETNAKWEQKRESFKHHIDLFINRMHLLQGNRKFKQWKGSVVDSVVGVFLTQNVSDYLSSNAFMSVAANFPTSARESLDSLAYYIEEPQDVSDSIPEVEKHEKSAKRKNEKTGIMEDEIVDWKTIRSKYAKEGSRHRMHIDSVNWNDVRLSDQKVFENIIRKRGQYRILSRRILKFLNDEVKQNGTIDLEWLRDAPSDIVKRYLLEIEGIGLKSAECVRLLGLKHSAFPVDTNVGRIAIRLGWVPLEPLPHGVQMHQLYEYPSMDSIQKYLWPRLCKLPHETLYELHYQMITFGKVFCTKVIPNCNACPMKSECKYFASAYISSKVLLEGPEEKTHEADTFKDVNVNMTSNINLIEECASPTCKDQAICCKPLVEFPSSPRVEIPEITDIEDTPCINPYQPYAKIPEIDIDLDALKKNVEDALVEGGKVLSISDDKISKAMVLLTPENACIPIKPPRKMKYYDRLRTEHVVYVLPDDHELLQDFEKRELDDPSPYLLAIWQPGETSNSFTQPKKKCDLDGSKLCKKTTCSYCWSIREQSSNIFRGTILIPCRTAMRAGFPLNGTYFQTNEVFADHETSLNPLMFPREWCDGLEKRAMYCGSSVTSIFRLLDTRRIQLCFWTGFLCMRAFDRKHRTPEELVRRLHTPPDERGAKHMKDDDI